MSSIGTQIFMANLRAASDERLRRSWEQKYEEDKKQDEAYKRRVERNKYSSDMKKLQRESLAAQKRAQDGPAPGIDPWPEGYGYHEHEYYDVGL